MKKYLPYLILSITALIVISLRLNIQVINPFYTYWLLQGGDWASHQLGWQYFLSSPWTIPLGSMQWYSYPQLSNIILTDSIPVYAVFWKLILAPLQINEFQYIGLWIWQSIFLNGVIAYKIVRRIGYSSLQGVLIAILFQFLPLILLRFGHPALLSHWLILIVIYWYIRILQDKSYKVKLQYLIVLSLLAITIHIYLFVMVFALLIPIFVYNNHTYKYRIISFLTTISILILVFFSINGISNTKILTSDGLGYYAVDLTSAIIPLENISSILPEQNILKGEYEGILYPGLGLLIMIVAAAIIFFYKRYYLTINKYELVFLIILILTILSIFSILNENYFELLKLFPGGEIIYKIAQIFRANGRFIWPIFYSFIILSLWVWKKFIPSKYLTLIIVGLFLVQILDLRQLLTNNSIYPQVNIQAQSNRIKGWEDSFDEFNIIYVYPPYQDQYIKDGDAVDMLIAAQRQQKSITLGHLAREDSSIQNQIKNKILNDIINYNLESGALYVLIASDLDSEVIDKIKVNPDIILNFYQDYTLISSKN